MPLLPQPIRLFCDVTKKTTPIDINAGTNSQASLWTGEDAQIDFGLGSKGALVTDLSNVSTVTLEVFDSQTAGSAATPLITKTLAIGALNTALVQADWDSGAAAHGSFLLTHQDTNLALGGADQKMFWLKISVMTTDTPAKEFPVAEGQIQWLANPSSDGSGAVQGGNLIAGGSVYSGGGTLVLAVTAGKVYQWTKNGHDTSVTNGTETVVASGLFTAQGATVTLNGTASATVTAVVYGSVFVPVDVSDARYMQSCPPGANFRFVAGQLQIWDQTAYVADSTKPWRALAVDNGVVQVSAPIAN